jgi:hypothetical protein
MPRNKPSPTHSFLRLLNTCASTLLKECLSSHKTIRAKLLSAAVALLRFHSLSHYQWELSLAPLSLHRVLRCVPRLIMRPSPLASIIHNCKRAKSITPPAYKLQGMLKLPCLRNTSFSKMKLVDSLISKGTNRKFKMLTSRVCEFAFLSSHPSKNTEKSTNFML